MKSVFIHLVTTDCILSGEYILDILDTLENHANLRRYVSLQYVLSRRYFSGELVNYQDQCLLPIHIMKKWGFISDG